MAFSSIPHYSRIISASLDTLLLFLLIFLLIFKSRGHTTSFLEWQQLTRFYVFILSFGSIFLIFHALFLLGCQNNADFQSGLCITTYVGWCASLCCALYFFALSTVFAYKRLNGVMVGSREHKFWEGYKSAVIAAIAAQLAVNGVMAYTGNTGSVLDLLSTSPSLLVTGLRIAFLVTVGFLILLIMGASTFCYYKMLWIILSTSSKLAKLKRTDDKERVLVFQRKLYALIVLAAFLSVLMTLDFIFNRIIFLFLMVGMTFCGVILVSFAIVLLHLLEIIRDSIQNFAAAPAEEVGRVTELSEVSPFSDSQIERLETDRIRNSRMNGN
jgi:hypothetical protein